MTDGMSDAKNPVFDKSGKYLYFTASTDSGPALEAGPAEPRAQARRAASTWWCSRKDDPSPLAPESDDEKAKKEEAKKEEAKKDEPKKRRRRRGCQDRLRQYRPAILALPMPARHYAVCRPAKRA